MNETAPPPPPQRPQKPPPTNKTAGRLIMGIAGFGLLAFVGLTVGALLLARQEWSPTVSENSFLELHVGGDISDAPEEGGLFMDPNDFPPILTEVTAAVRRAATDERIKGLYVEIEAAPGGWSSTQELRDALVAFGESGKPCYAFANALDNKAYYLATGCKEIYLAPAGLLLVNGLSATTSYYLGTFEKIGVQGSFEHVGDFKSAIEPYQRTGPSDPASEAMDMLIGGLYDQMVAGIAQGRGVEPAQVQAWIDNPPITGESALAAGMINGLKYRDEVADDMAGEERTGLGSYIKSNSALLPKSKKIAVIHVEGTIIDGESGSPFFGGRMVGDQTVAEYFEDVREDDEVAAVVLRVNSPGGSGLASDNMWREVERTKAAGKPVVVSMGDYAASGGYYISAGADRILAEPGTITGSIGVFGGKLALGGAYEKLGITSHTWQRGQMANIFSELTVFSDPERAKFREFLEGFYGVFLDRVATGRKMEKEKVHEVAQGRVWTGQQALERGLVDELGGLERALVVARELGKVAEGEEVDILRLPRQKTFFEQLAEDMQPQAVAPELMLPGVREAWSQLEAVSRALEGSGVAAMMPGVVDIH